MTVKELIQHFKDQRYEVYRAPYRLNIVGIRAETSRPNVFDDLIVVFFVDQKGKWHLHAFPATTDPGTYWLENPIEAAGTAILKAGQYVDCYSIDRHQGKYYALCQRKGKVTVIRDYDRNAILDLANGREDSGFFGINIHRARSSGTTRVVDKYSAGCQVFARAEDFSAFMKMCELHRKLHGNLFTYTLIDQRSLVRASRRRWVGRALAIGAAVAALFGISQLKTD